MDLNRLYRYRRGELEREARRLGVERPERLDRRELDAAVEPISNGRQIDYPRQPRARVHARAYWYQ